MRIREILSLFRGKIFCIKCKIFKRKVLIGKGLQIYEKLELEGPGEIVIGDNCIINGVKGDRSQYVTLYTHHERAKIHIGNNCKLFAARISSKYGIFIGNNVAIEEAGIMDTDFHSIENVNEEPINENLERCMVFIGDGVTIAARSIVTKGCKIGDYAVVMPGSIVNGSIESGRRVLGNPAKIINS